MVLRAQISKTSLTVLTVVLCLSTTFMSFRGMLHSNPMDYAWGANGLDAIITQVHMEIKMHIIKAAVVSQEQFQLKPYK